MSQLSFNFRMAKINIMEKENGISHPVNIHTEREIIIVNKGWFIFFKILLFVIHGSVGIWISAILYNEGLHCMDCNNFVIIFFALVALGCFANMGLPIEKMSNIKVS